MSNDSDNTPGPGGAAPLDPAPEIAPTLIGAMPTGQDPVIAPTAPGLPTTATAAGAPQPNGSTQTAAADAPQASGNTATAAASPQPSGSTAPSSGSAAPAGGHSPPLPGGTSASASSTPNGNAGTGIPASTFLNKVKMGLAAAVATAAVAVGVFGPHLNTTPDLNSVNGCGLGGKATNAMQTASNPLKNRFSFPSTQDIDTQVNLDIMLKKTKGGLDDHKAASVEGYITKVKEGGVESCNCGATLHPFMDTHIYVNKTPLFDAKNAVIVEVTPRLRQEMQGTADWSTASLIKLLPPGTKARITGWLFYDAEHENAAENIQSRPHNWRGTCWEIHPVTGIEMENDEQDAPVTAPAGTLAKGR